MSLKTLSHLALLISSSCLASVDVRHCTIIVQPNANPEEKHAARNLEITSQRSLARMFLSKSSPPLQITRLSSAPARSPNASLPPFSGIHLRRSRPISFAKEETWWLREVCLAAWSTRSIACSRSNAAFAGGHLGQPPFPTVPISLLES